MRVVVIGGGIVGAAAAYYLTGRGASVTVVDGGYQGEATQAGAGIVCPWVDHPEDDDWYRLNREGARAYPGLVEALGEDFGYAKVGALLVAEDPAELEPVRSLLHRRYADAPEMGEVVDVPAPAELFPPLSYTLSALLVPGAARVDGRSVRDALLNAAVARGARIHAGAATLTPDGEVRVHAAAGAPSGEGGTWTPGGGTGQARNEETGSWRQAAPRGPAAPQGSDATQGSQAGPRPQAARGSEVVRPVAAGAGRVFADEGVPVEADAVIVAGGAWTGEVCRPLGAELPVFPRRGQILHATLEGVDTAWWPIVLPSDGPYLLGFPGSRVVIGATVEDVGFAPRVTMGGLEEVLQAGLRIAPGLAGATVTETRVGLRPVYAPGRALIGPLNSRVVVATGLSAYGLTAGPYAGRLAAALALGETPPIDLTPYAPTCL